jgi:DNA-binding Xre family transcriptional regulator
MPFYSSFTEAGKLQNKLRDFLGTKRMSSFGLSKLAGLSPTTTRKIYADPLYLPSPEVLEKLCLSLECTPNDILEIKGRHK